jgi:plasmid stabilization system protein ParE
VVELHAEALAELRDAAGWYETQRPGLGDEFVAEVARTLTRIEANAAGFPKWPSVTAAGVTIRRVVVERFPYAVAFEARGGDAFVLAIAHVRRRPLYWLRRAL